MSSSAFDIMSFLPIVLLLGVFYFLLIRPQQKKMKAHQDMLSGLKRGDKIVTNGGLIGEVVKIVSDQEVQLEIAEGTRVRVIRQMINNVMTKTTGGQEISVQESRKEDSSMDVSNDNSKVKVLKTPLKKPDSKPISKTKKK